MAPFQRSFEYQALHGTNSTRVIKVFPALKRDSPIIIDLSEFTLNSSIEYEALSYTWDNQKPTRDIACNEKSLRVTENVFQAIRQLRSGKARKRSLWIDAICINQKDEAEKTSQVSMMGDIYAGAQRVNVWLDHSTEAMRAAFEYVRLSNSPKLRFDHVSDENIALLNVGLEQLCSHPYWSRIWTVQEVALSKNCWIYLGQLSPMKWLEFTAMLWDVEGYMNKRSEETTQPDLEYLYPVSFKRWSPSTATHLHSTLRSESLATDFGDFGEIIRHLIGKKAKVPLDIIFACRALFPESIGQIKVNYQTDLIGILKEVTVRIIPQFQRLGGLLEVVSHCLGIPGAPSWMLNITGGERVWNACHYFGVWNATRSMDVSSTTTTNCSMTHRISSDMETLHVKGIIVDRVTAISDKFPHYALENQARWHEKVRDMLTQWRISTQKCLNMGFEESIIDILFAATSIAEELADKVSQTNRLEKIFSYDEDGTLLTNSAYRVHRVKNPPDRDLQAAERGNKKKARISALCEWMNDPDINYRLDYEEILSSTHSEGYCQPTIHSPALGGRNLFVISRGEMALGKNLQLGDAIALIAGCDVPFALRQVPQGDSYTLGQPVLLAGVMSGQAWPEDQNEKLEDIKIV